MSMKPKEVVRELIRTEKPQSTQDVLDLLKEMFKDVLQGALVQRIIATDISPRR